MRTPVTEQGLRKFDDLPSAEAILRAWTEAGRFPHHHRWAQSEVRSLMPVLERALNRLARESSSGA